MSTREPGSDEGPSRFHRDFGRNRLEILGPSLRARWEVTTEEREMLLSQGRSVPLAVEGEILVDTGCQLSNISRRAVEALGLRPTGFETSYNMTGRSEIETYPAKLTVLCGEGADREQDFFVAGEFGVVPMDQHGDFIRSNNIPFDDHIGLLGRDFLRFARVLYDGWTGDLVVEFDRAAFRGRTTQGFPP